MPNRASSIAMAGMAVAMGMTPTAAAESTTLYVPGTNPIPALDGPVDLSWLDGGSFANGATQVGYPASLSPVEGADTLDDSVGVGTDHLNTAIYATPGPKKVLCLSQGCVVVANEKKALNADPNAPKDITFVQVADPTNPSGLMGRNPGLSMPGLGITFVGEVQSDYPTTVISRQYDGIADWPAQQLNVVADANAVMGAVYLHPHYDGLDLSTVTPTVAGNTTTYRVPTPNLPLVQPLRDIGIAAPIVDAIQAPLKVVVDAGYQQPAVKPKRKPSSTSPAVVTLTSPAVKTATSPAAPPSDTTSAASTPKKDATDTATTADTTPSDTTPSSSTE